MSLVVNTYRDITEGYFKRLQVKAAAAPFQGSLLGCDANGYVRPLVAGDPFRGVAEEQLESIIAGNVPTTDGGNTVQARVGRFKMVMTLAGVTLANVFKRSQVYATDDTTVSLNPSAGTGTLIGVVDGIAPGTNQVIIECNTAERLQAAPMTGGIFLGADGAVTLTTFHLDKLIVIPNTAARTYTLPPAADCAGRFLSFLKSTAAAFAITLAGNAAENINGANTNATALPATQYKATTLYCDGTQWFIVSNGI